MPGRMADDYRKEKDISIMFHFLLLLVEFEGLMWVSKDNYKEISPVVF